MEIKNPVIQTSKLSKAYGIEHAVRFYFCLGQCHFIGLSVLNRSPVIPSIVKMSNFTLDGKILNLWYA